MDLAQLRKQAKELKAAVLASEPAAVGRVLASHPKLAGRPAGMDGVRFGLRDAQATLARELGFDGWESLLEAASGTEVATTSPGPRWAQRSEVLARAFAQAQREGAAAASGRHVLAALLRSPGPTTAREVLLAVGASLETGASKSGQPVSTSSTIPLHALEAFAAALALADGRGAPSDEDLLLALVYEHRNNTGSALLAAEIDPDEVYDLLAAHGVRVPQWRPPAPPPPTGPSGPRVYVRDEHANAVSRLLLMHHPPGTLQWGTNVSRWKPGWRWFDAEEAIDLADLSRVALKEHGETAVLVVPFTDAVREEARSQRR
jgi:hypothetical protein